MKEVYQLRIDLSVSSPQLQTSKPTHTLHPLLSQNIFLPLFLFTHTASPSCSSPKQSQGQIIPPTGRRTVHTQLLTAGSTLAVRTLGVTIFLSNANTIAGRLLYVKLCLRLVREWCYNLSTAFRATVVEQWLGILIGQTDTKAKLHFCWRGGTICAGNFQERKA